jgi:lysophospholipase L1-like esterase
VPCQVARGRQPDRRRGPVAAPCWATALPGNREVGNREVGNREVGNREVGNREVGNREVGNREVGNREVGNREAGNPPEAGQPARSCDLGLTGRGGYPPTPRVTVMKTRTRLLSGLGAILVASSGVVAGAAQPATASPANHGDTSIGGRSYVALGDSFAAGLGADFYSNVSNGCFQSTKGYPALLDAVKGIDLVGNASCSGYTTTQVQANLPSSLNWSTKLVTVTVGGDDVNVAGVALACVNGPTACASAIDAASLLLPSLMSDLATTYGDIAKHAPRARVLVTGYPYLFETPGKSDPTYGTILQINQATDLLNATIHRAVKSAGKNFQFVDLTTPFAGHGIGSANPWINSPFPSPFFPPTPYAVDVFHPNAAGYVAYEHALLAELRAANAKKAPCRNR